MTTVSHGVWFPLSSCLFHFLHKDHLRILASVFTSHITLTSRLKGSKSPFDLISNKFLCFWVYWRFAVLCVRGPWTSKGSSFCLGMRKGKHIKFLDVCNMSAQNKLARERTQNKCCPAEHSWRPVRIWGESSEILTVFFEFITRSIGKGSLQLL